MTKKAGSILITVMLLILSMAAFECTWAQIETQSAQEPTPEQSLVHTKPLWEVGIFGGGARIPAYRGSKTYETYVFPAPFLIYRGEIFQSDREGASGIFYRSERLESTLSFGGNIPVDADNTAREGMDDLDPIIEVGPALKWYFLGRFTDQYLYFRPALRAAISIGLPDDVRTHFRGWRLSLNLTYWNDALFGNEQWAMGASAGVNFSDAEYHDYFYGVDDDEARPGRPAYEADAGYAGLGLSSSILYRITQRLSLSAYGRWGNIAGAAFDDSPLVETENNYTVGAAVIWTIFESDERVDARYRE